MDEKPVIWLRLTPFMLWVIFVSSLAETLTTLIAQQGLAVLLANMINLTAKFYWFRSLSFDKQQTFCSG